MRNILKPLNIVLFLIASAAACAVPYFLMTNLNGLVWLAIGVYVIMLPIMLVVAGFLDSRHRFANFTSYGGVVVGRTIAGKMTLSSMLMVGSLAAIATLVVSVLFAPNLMLAIIGAVVAIVMAPAALYIRRDVNTLVREEKSRS